MRLLHSVFSCEVLSWELIPCACAETPDLDYPLQVTALIALSGSSNWLQCEFTSLPSRIMDTFLTIVWLLALVLFQSTLQLTIQRKFSESRQVATDYDTSRGSRYKYEIKTFDVRVSSHTCLTTVIENFITFANDMFRRI